MTNNIIQRVTVTAGDNGQGLDTHAGVDFLFEGNTIIDCEVGIAIVGSVVSGVALLGPKNCIASNNHIIGASSIGYGFLISGAIVGSTVNGFAENITLTNNVIKNHGITGDSLTGAIQLQGTKQCTVVGNTIENASPFGINANLSNIGFNITGNTIKDPHDASIATPACIAIRNDDNRGLISGTTFIFADASLATFVGVESISIFGSLTGLDLAIRTCEFIGIASGRLALNALTTTGVDFTGMYRESGQDTISVVNTGIDGITDVVFEDRFPYAPKVIPVLRRPFNQGGKFPILGIDTVVAISETGFRIYALPVDGTTWTATGSLTFDWIAE